MEKEIEIMTNREKAREIAEYYTDTNDIGVALNSAKEMAEWKDAQFKGYLLKLREDIVNHEIDEEKDSLYYHKQGFLQAIDRICDDMEFINYDDE